MFVLDHTRLSVWVLDGDPGHANLLKFALNAERFPHTLVMLVASMTTPWAVLDQLQSWAKLLSDHIEKLAEENSSFNEVLKRCRELSKYLPRFYIINLLLTLFLETMTRCNDKTIFKQ